MAGGAALVYSDRPGSIPAGYTLPPSFELLLGSVSAVIDGASASGAFLACLAIYSQDGKLVGRYFPSQTFSPGDSGEVTWAPFLGGSQAASGTVATGSAIDLRNPRVSSLAGNAFFTVLGFTDWDSGVWSFKKDVDGKVYGIIRLGSELPASAQITLEIAASATSGVTRLNIATHGISDGQSFDPSALDNGTAQDVTVSSTAYGRKSVTFDVPSTLVANDVLIVEIFHEGSHGNDTLNANTLLWGAYLGDGG